MTQKTPPRSVNLPPTSVAHAPAVPISVYREVVAELQATKTAMESIKTENQKLAQQNQQLRQEIEKTVQAALQLRKFSNAIQPSTAPSAPRVDLTIEEPTFHIPVMPPRMLAEPVAEPLPPHLELKPLEPIEEKLIIEQDSKPRRKIKPEKESYIELNGWMLAVVIGLIVISAFGAGFLLVRPLLAPSSK
ncbi:hypothetical protein [Leptolyngbya sp. NIES-2104]|uniref:hypothetical protein n=1 Tax=Leptolyngbya sp. NIES-2104 TaxID=1552121 RepID=UPI0006ECAB2F|nr:hypothetical protein [Leptolyngbya sp. NIES-2104]GAP98402.1 hypothetical protein NIES2104_49570 [Leptolyngbya sp. NIES-2104]